MKKVQVGYLPPERPEDPPHYLDKPGILEVRHSSPKRGWTTARFEAYLLNCRVHLTVVGPEAKQPKDGLPLSSAQVEDIAQAASNLVVALKKHAFGEAPPAP